MSEFNKLIPILFLSLLIGCTNQNTECKPKVDVDVQMEEIPKDIKDVEKSLVPTAKIVCTY